MTIPDITLNPGHWAHAREALGITVFVWNGVLSQQRCGFPMCCHKTVMDVTLNIRPRIECVPTSNREQPWLLGRAGAVLAPTS